MNALVRDLALALSAAGLLAALLASLKLRSLSAGIPMMLELWTAAVLLRLSAEPSFADIAIAAVLIVVRRVVSSGLLRKTDSCRARHPAVL